jgi:hypothetical protein
MYCHNLCIDREYEKKHVKRFAKARRCIAIFCVSTENMKKKHVKRFAKARRCIAIFCVSTENMKKNM